ncbi:MAG TPA: hypothetical protein VF221_06220 [Chloroflexota bacterium]
MKDDNTASDDHDSLIDKARDAVERLRGEAETREYFKDESINTPGAGYFEDTSPPYTGPNASASPSYDSGIESGDEGEDAASVTDYGTEMGGGNTSPDPTKAYNANAQVRSVYDPESNRPGSYDEPGISPTEEKP